MNPLLRDEFIDQNILVPLASGLHTCEHYSLSKIIILLLYMIKALALRLDILVDAAAKLHFESYVHYPNESV